MSVLRSHRYTIIAIVGCLSFAALIWWALRPNNPVLPTYQEPQKQSATYRPGGAGCDPTQLRRLSGTEAVEEANRCSQSAEEHRLQSNDLIQQTRAADAAQASTTLSFNQSLIALAGSIIGFFTLVAAIIAAFYAKRAAEAAERSITHSRETSEQELRAHLVIENEKVSRSEEAKKPFLVSFVIRNVGVTPAKSLTIKVIWLFQYDNGGVHQIYVTEYVPMSLAHGAVADVERSFSLPKDESRAFKEGKGKISALVEADFQDGFGEHWTFRQALAVRCEGMSTGKVHTEHCEHTRSKEAQSRPRRPKALLTSRFKRASQDA